MKKGFTLVELAIVIVVIGILLSLAVKGKGIVDTAKVKNDVNKVLKIKTALASFYSKYHTVPGVSGGAIALRNDIMYTDLIKEGLVKADDFKRSGANTYYHFIGCDSSADGWKYGEMSLNASGGSALPYICLMENNITPLADTSSGSSSANVDVSLKDICYYETMIDDRDVLTGEGRLAGTGTVDLGKFDCKQQKSESAKYIIRIM